MNNIIMIVEDDESIRRLLEVALQSQGFETASFDNAISALDSLKENLPAVAIFDVMMEGMDGVTAVKLMRQNEKCRKIPVIMLTAKGSESDKIAGLDAGADDYVTKPFSVLELCARVRAQLRRTGDAPPTPEAKDVYEEGGIRLDAGSREVSRNGQLIDLTFKEFELLQTLMANSGKALSRDEILRKVWGEDYFGETRTLDMHIGSLRHKLSDSAENSQCIKTVRGVGYRFVGGSL